VILKTETLTQAASQVLRSLSGQNPNLATPYDIRWLGFSYIAFRLLHTLRDRINGRLPEVSLRDFLTYTIFFPALTAGPIDKIQRFVKDLEQDFTLNAEQLLESGIRILTGIFIKFAVADTLALFALNETNSLQTESSLWMWVLTYAYAFRIYFDFAGYTHIAIGIGMLFGMQLPENFNQPYLKPNLTQFWNSWHMTLAQWFRAYFFNPFTRALRERKVRIPVIILFGQLGTMVLIGLWHGVTWNFVIWGLWHGLGLFIHNRWAEFNKTRSVIKNQKLANLLGILITFHYVLLGWVWFALPTLDQALRTFIIMFGGSG
jgi:D-alanyl-lipoteichoic acid acyltransferase DltB (MBOAT superfamily)